MSEDDFFCKGKCVFCDGNGHLTIPEPKYYEAILYKHHIIADLSLRKKKMMSDIIKKLEAEFGEVTGLKKGCFEIELHG